jgi:hypothetical protein
VGWAYNTSAFPRTPAVPEILVVYYSRHGAVREMAQWAARGIEEA